jgi:Geminivirus Rep catalytic domain.
LSAQALVLEPRHWTVDDFDELGLLSHTEKPRLLYARSMFLKAENRREMGFESLEECLGLLESLFSYWESFSEFLLLKREDLKSKNVEYVAVKCSKRGNDVYAARLSARLGWLEDHVPNVEFFKIKDFQVDRRVSSRLLWVTLTWDTNRSSLMHAWEHLGEDFNRFMSSLKRKYGKISIFRVWESYKNGYPHVHAVIYFHEAEFKVFPHWSSKEKKLVFRIEEKAEISEFWHSHVDIQAISSTSALFTYIRKHQKNILMGLGNPSVVEEAPSAIGLSSMAPSGLRSLALCWLFRKRSFSVSGDFREVLSDLIRTLHNSNMLGQQNLLGERVPDVSWLFVGIFSGERLGVPPWMWAARIEVDVVERLLGND